MENKIPNIINVDGDTIEVKIITTENKVHTEKIYLKELSDYPRRIARDGYLIKQKNGVRIFLPPHRIKEIKYIKL